MTHNKTLYLAITNKRNKNSGISGKTLLTIIIFSILAISLSNSLEFEQNRKPDPTLNSELFKKAYSQEIGAQNHRLAFVIPQFTSAAYQENGFYTFYAKYANITNGINVTKDLHMLSVNQTSINTKYHYPIDDRNYSDPNSPFTFPFRFLSSHFSMLLPSLDIDIIKDVDVHNGLIFNSENPNINKYDIIMLGHQEYVTHEEYNHLKTFVHNDGILILLDSNIFYAEVEYDPITGQVTLIKGHGWGFNGKSAWEDVRERWSEENTEWIGSNFGCARCGITFSNMPFDYEHHEEQIITNSNVTILIDYEPVGSPHKIAAYEHFYGKGKVISLGIYGDDLIKQEGDLMRIDPAFLGFLDNILLDTYQFFELDSPDDLIQADLTRYNGVPLVWTH
jgi:hypothetical protein